MIEKIKSHFSLIIYAVLLIGSTVWVSFQGGVIPYALFFVMLLYLPVTFGYLILCRALLTSHQEMDTTFLKKGQKGRYSLVIENAGILPVGALRLVVAPNVFIFGEEFLSEEYSLMPRQRLSINTTIVCNYAGSYGVGVYRLVLRDPFDILKLDVDISQGTIPVSVKPNITDVAYNDLSSLLSDMNLRMRRYAQNRPSDTTGADVRGYISGDPISRIHWKNFAKTGELFTRLPENADLQMPVIILENDDFEVEESHMIQRDRFIEYAVSAADYFVRQNKPVRIIFYYFGVRHHLIDGYESFSEFYTDITRHLAAKKVVKEMELMEKAAGEGSAVLYLPEGENCGFCSR